VFIDTKKQIGAEIERDYFQGLQRINRLGERLPAAILTNLQLLQNTFDSHSVWQRVNAAFQLNTPSH